jgi:pimeloyl-ACP methyl ester carboxylesterase
MLRRVASLLVLLVGVQFAVTWAFVLWMHGRYAAYRRFKGLRRRDRGALGWVRVWAREVWALWLAQVWHLRLLGAHRRWVPDEVRGAPVLCVHGFTQNGTNFLRIQHRLHALGRPSEAVLLGYPPRPVSEYAALLEARLVALCADFDGPVDVICHSMGGLVLRWVLSSRPDLRARVGAVVTLGSPHHGTASGRGMVLFPEVRFMARRSAELAALPHLPDLLPHARVVNVGSEDDTTVYPVETTFERGAEHVLLDGLGHAGILVDDTAIDVILDALRRPSARAAG